MPTKTNTTITPQDQPISLSLARSIEARAWERLDTNWHQVVQFSLEHPESAKKDGLSYIAGTLIGSERKKGAVDALYLLTLDCDSGDDLKDICDRISTLGWEAIVHSTYSHLAVTSRIRIDDFKRHSGSTSATPTAVTDYLIKRKGMKESIAQSVEIVDSMEQTAQGVFIVVKHLPIQKGRVIFPLAVPFEIVKVMQTLNMSQREAHELWGRYLEAVAKAVGVRLDAACKDVSRAFYWASHPAGADYFAEHICGTPLDLDALLIERGNSKPGTNGATSTKQTDRLSTNHLDGFASNAAKRFNMATAITEEAPDRVRGNMSAAKGIVVECPFDDLHSNPGDPSDKACFVINAADSENENFVWKCHHASCQDRGRLEFVAKALEEGWFDESILYSGLYEEAALDPCCTARTLVEALTTNSGLAEKDAIYAHLAKCDDLLVQSDVLRQMKERAKIGIGESHRILADKQKKSRQEARVETGKPHFIYRTEQFDEICARAKALLEGDNIDEPHLFRMTSMLIRLSEDRVTKTLFQDPVTIVMLRQELNELATWGVIEKMVEKSISCPSDVAAHILNDPSLELPPLASIADAPFFDKHGNLIREPGYHAESFTYHHPRPGFAVEPVSETPSSEEVKKARDLLLTEIDGDFPFCDNTPDSRASKAHAVALKLEPFVRQMISGNTPIYLIQKPAPGTGASLFVNAFAEIAFGSAAIPQSEVGSADELRKNLTATLMSGTSLYWLDNVHQKIDNSSLALATTTEVWRDRVLGHSKTVIIPIRCSWIISGNNVELSEELTRRAVLIRFDANVERPTERKDFRHSELIEHIRENRGDYVWACLTLIRAWIAAGRPAGTTNIASYEKWAKVMGGILSVAGIPGFLENRADLKEVSTDSDGPMRSFVQLWFDAFGESRVRLSGTKNSASITKNTPSLLELYEEHCFDLDLGFNEKRRESWAQYLGTAINKYRNRVLDVSTAKGEPLRVKIHADTDSGGAVKWLSRV